MSRFFHRVFADNASDRSVATRLRRRRFELLRGLIEDLARPVSVLDVGGRQSYWEMMSRTNLELVRGLRITLYNLESRPGAGDGFVSVTGDARSLAIYDDRQFDLVFSNSTIEHVGTFADQRKMAEEVKRVGRRYYVQTPNRGFPVEPHFVFPLFQFLPLGLRAFLVSRFSLGWYPRIPDRSAALELVESIRLLSRAELQQLFPEGTIVAERYAGLTKSFVALSPRG